MGCVVWFTGVPSSGKSTLAKKLEKELREKNINVENLDSDEVRENLSPNLGYTAEARDENTKRLAWLASQLAKYNVIVLVTAVSPQAYHRKRAKEMAANANSNFLEVFVDAPIEVCQKRDPKGLYEKAEKGKVNDIAGLHIPYEKPQNPDIHIKTNEREVSDCVWEIGHKLYELIY
jgi:adenylylsulfate kinase